MEYMTVELTLWEGQDPARVLAAIRRLPAVATAERIDE